MFLFNVCYDYFRIVFTYMFRLYVQKLSHFEFSLQPFFSPFTSWLRRENFAHAHQCRAEKSISFNEYNMSFPTNMAIFNIGHKTLSRPYITRMSESLNAHRETKFFVVPKWLFCFILYIVSVFCVFCMIILNSSN